jgi:beta-glucanase (GH16 family)
VAVVGGCGSTPGTPEPQPSATADVSAAPVTPRPTPQPTPTATPYPSPDTASWPLAWSDEFDGPKGTPPDPATWGYELGDGSAVGLTGWGNNERQFYTDDPANVSLDGDGNLLITVRAGDGGQSCWYGPCEYTSARLTTRDRRSIEYGRIEARIRVPDGFGVWPAFWMLGTNIDQAPWPACGEIDIMEYLGRVPNDVMGTIHGPGYSGSSSFGQSVTLDEPVSAAFHTFAIEWWPGHIGWFLDGKPYHEASPADVAPNAWAFDHPFYVLLNVAVGGNLGGLIDPNLPLPLSMAVDYIRVYQGIAP